MNFTNRLSLFWRRFSPVEERLLAAVREVLPAQAQSIFDAQVAGITLVQRHPRWTEIAFYRRRGGKVDWSDTPGLPRRSEFPLAEVRFTVEKRRYKATLTAVSGHIFDFSITPSPKAIAFARWDSAPSTRLLADPLATDAARPPEPLPPAWRDFLARHPQPSNGWAFHGPETSYRTTFDEGEFLVLAEREGDEFVLHPIEPAASGLFYLASHDAKPTPVQGTIDKVFSTNETRTR